MGLGLADGYGTGAFADKLEALVAQRRLEAMQALAAQRAEDQRQITNTQKERELTGQEEDRRIATQRRSDLDEANSLGQAIDNLGFDADATALVTPLLASKSPETQNLIRGLRRIDAPNVVATLGQLGTTAKYMTKAAPVPQESSMPREDLLVDNIDQGALAYHSRKGEDFYTFASGPNAGQRVTGKITRKPSAGEENNEPPDQGDVEKAANIIIGHRMAPSQAFTAFSGRGNAGLFKRAVTLAVDQMTGNKFDWQEAESNYQFGKNPATQNTVRYLANIQKSVPVLERVINAVNPSDFPIINAATLGASKKFGADQVAAFDFAQTMLADEIAKVLQGGGANVGTSDAKLHQAQDLLSHDMNKAQWQTVLSIAHEMLAARRGSLTEGTYLEGKGPGAPVTATPDVTVTRVNGKLVLQRPPVAAPQGTGRQGGPGGGF